jgi:hypothetical protein
MKVNILEGKRKLAEKVNTLAEREQQGFGVKYMLSISTLNCPTSRARKLRGANTVYVGLEL